MNPRDAGRVVAEQYQPYHPWGGLGAKTLRLRQLVLNLNITQGVDARYVIDLDTNRSMLASGAGLPRRLSREDLAAPMDDLDPIMTFKLPDDGVPFSNDTSSPDINAETAWSQDLVKIKLESGEVRSFQAADFPSGHYFEVGAILDACEVQRLPVISIASLMHLLLLALFWP